MNRVLAYLLTRALPVWGVTALNACGLNGGDASSDPRLGDASGTGAAGRTTNTGSSLPGSTTTFLGRACERDFDCGSGLVCIGPSSKLLGGKGAPGGYCSRTCEAGSDDCGTLAPGATCHDFGGYTQPARYCVLGCTVGPAPAGTKCQGRRDVACTPLKEGATSVMSCMPRCSSDQDCCTAAGACETFCDPATGLCSRDQRTGGVIGAACMPSTAWTCRGNCQALPGEASASSTFVCTELCTVGAYPACNWGGPSDGPAPALCSLASAEMTERGGPSAGDAAACVALCDCDSDCPSAVTYCQPFDDSSLALATGRVGSCVAKSPSAGSTSCDGTGGTQAGSSTSTGSSQGAGAAASN